MPSREGPQGREGTPFRGPRQLVVIADAVVGFTVSPGAVAATSVDGAPVASALA